MPAGQIVHRKVEIEGDRFLCEACGWVPIAYRMRRGKRSPLCHNARKKYRGKPTKQKHRERRGSECEICGSTRNLHADHDHAHCKNYSCARCFRGTLCGRCNWFVGLIERKQRDMTLSKVLEYIEERRYRPPA